MMTFDLQPDGSMNIFAEKSDYDRNAWGDIDLIMSREEVFELTKTLIPVVKVDPRYFAVTMQGRHVTEVTPEKRGLFARVVKAITEF